MAFERLVFSDTFTRSNSNAVGNGWTEGGEQTASDIGIESNQLRLGNQNATAVDGYVYQPITVRKYPFMISMKARINQTPVLARSLEIHPRVTTPTINSNVRVLINASEVQSIIIMSSSGTEAQQSFSLSANTDYYIWIEVYENGSNYDVKAYVSTSSTKPGTATVSATDIAADSYFGTNSGFYLDHYDNGAETGCKWYVDNFTLYETPVPVNRAVIIG